VTSDEQKFFCITIIATSMQYGIAGLLCVFLFLVHFRYFVVIYRVIGE